MLNLFWRTLTLTVIDAALVRAMGKEDSEPGDLVDGRAPASTSPKIPDDITAVLSQRGKPQLSAET